jgi:hypothetical protein
MHDLAMAAASVALAVGGALALAPSAQAVSPPLTEKASMCEYDSGGYGISGDQSEDNLGYRYQCTTFDGWQRY